MSRVSADYIVVGGGSAGAVIAARLSENPGVSVLLLEAGGGGRDFLIKLPAGVAKLFANPKYDWIYEAEPDESLGGRPFLLPAGKGLGGSSSINGMIHIRGTRSDYDNWARLGADGWDYAGVEPYFKRSENFQGPPSQQRGTTGPIAVSFAKDYPPTTYVYLEACRAMGFEVLEDYADGKMDGVFLCAGSIDRGWRSSTEAGYLRPAAKRPNLTVLTGADVRRVLFDGTRAIGVEAVIDGRETRFEARREVILSAGAIGTPALLLRSGVGEAEHLREQGVPLVHDAPEVGRNLQDHVGVPVGKFVNVPTLNTQTGLLDMIKHVFQFVTARKGLLAGAVGQGLGLARSRPELAEPDMQLMFAAFGISNDQTKGTEMLKEAAVTLWVNPCRPHNSGTVRLNPAKKYGVEIDLQLLGSAEDVATLVRGAKLLQRIFEQDAWKPYLTGNRIPDPVPETDADWEAHVRSTAQSNYHLAGTCRMGTDAGAVVDPQLRVRGVSGLRVADASIMPALVSGNTNAAAIMIGEKAAAIIAGADDRARAA